MDLTQDDQVAAPSQLTVKRAGENDLHNATYSFQNEDHTLGNLLRN